MAGGRFRLRNYEFSSRMRRVTLPGDWQTGDWQIGIGPSSLKGVVRNAARCSRGQLAPRFAELSSTDCRTMTTLTALEGLRCSKTVSYHVSRADVVPQDADVDVHPHFEVPMLR